MVEQSDPTTIKEHIMTSRRVLRTRLDDLIPAGDNRTLKLPTRQGVPRDTLSLGELVERLRSDSPRALAELLLDLQAVDGRDRKDPDSSDK